MTNRGDSRSEIETAVDDLLGGRLEFADLFEAWGAHPISKELERREFKLVVDFKPCPNTVPNLRGSDLPGFGADLGRRLIERTVSIHELIGKRNLSKFRVRKALTKLAVCPALRIAHLDEEHVDDRVHPSQRTMGAFRLALEFGAPDIPHSKAPITKDPPVQKKSRSRVSIEEIQTEIRNLPGDGSGLEKILQDSRLDSVGLALAADGRKFVIDCRRSKSNVADFSPSIARRLARIDAKLGADFADQLLAGTRSTYEILVFTTPEIALSYLRRNQILPTIRLAPLAEPHPDDRFRVALSTRRFLLLVLAESREAEIG